MASILSALGKVGEERFFPSQENQSDALTAEFSIFAFQKLFERHHDGIDLIIISGLRKTE